VGVLNTANNSNEEDFSNKAVQGNKDKGTVSKVSVEYLCLRGWVYVLCRTYRLNYEILFHFVILSKHHHHHHQVNKANKGVVPVQVKGVGMSEEAVVVGQVR
jgi:hypothetical protein